MLVLAAMKRRGEDTFVFDPIINDLRYLLMAWPNSVVSHVQRERNSVAHRLAQIGITNAQEVVWFEEPPDLIQAILLKEGL